MKKLHFSVIINAPKEKVWHTMLDAATYSQWTAVFNPVSTSYFEGNWEKGSTMRFIGPDPKTGKAGGMLSRVAENKPAEFMSIEHVGIIVNGVEDTTSDEAKKWVPAFENYTFVDKDGGTEVLVDVDTADEMAEEFARMWPEALQKLKALAEA